MSYPLVSVIFISYKRIDLLKQTVQSFLKNTHYPNLELILCDDGSPFEIQNEMKTLPFNKFLFSTRNEGMGSNTNKGIRASLGDFILQLQDDWIYNGRKDFIEKAIETFNQVPELGLLRFRTKICEKFLKEEEIEINEENILVILTEKYPYEDGWGKIYTDTPHIKRKSFHEKIGYYLTCKNMEVTELDFCRKSSQQIFFKIGYLKNYKEIFEHIGEKDSFRTNSFKKKIMKNITENKVGKLVYNAARKFLKH
jgi:glycosyltransferase involved in cell wall biosynthesis